MWEGWEWVYEGVYEGKRICEYKYKYKYVSMWVCEYKYVDMSINMWTLEREWEWTHFFSPWENGLSHPSTPPKTD